MFSRCFPSIRRWLAILAVLASGAAQAHAILLESRPSAGSTLAPGAGAVALRFNCRVDPLRSRLVLEAGHDQTKVAIDPASAEDTLAAKVQLAPGDYRLHWQVLAVDGHITRGDIRFTVAR